MTSAVQPTGQWTGDAFVHEAFVFDDDSAVAERCVPFVEEGLERDEQVIVVAGERVRGVLARRLGGDLGRLALFAPAESWWQGGHETLGAYDRDLRGLLASGRSWRLIGEPVWLGYRGGAVWSRYEAVANQCYAAYPYYSLCLHDRRRLRPDLVERALRTHPMVWGGSEPVASPNYVSTEDYLRSVEPPWSDRPPDAGTLAVLTPRELRAAVAELAVGGWAGRRDDMVLALHELAANALQAAGVVAVRWWTDGSEMVWEVSDPGPGMHDVTAGYVPPAPDPESGRGLWLARGLADDATVRASGPGTAIRLYFRPA